MKTKRLKVSLVISLTLLLGLSACSKVTAVRPAQKPVVLDTKITTSESKPVINPNGTLQTSSKEVALPSDPAARLEALLSSRSGNRKEVAPGASITATATASAALLTSAPSINVSVTVDRKAILEQEFMYGADLQYSSQYDSDMDLYTQSYAVPHQIARFRIAGDELQLVTDNTLNFPSDVNHPEQVLSRFKILSRNETTLTLSGANSAITLAQIFGPVPGATGVSVLDHWIRSFEFDPNGNYILQQTSIMLPDGTIGEFMEAIFPRQTIAAGKDFQIIPMDPENPIGGDTELHARFRFLDSPPIFDGETKLSFAQHFDISPKADGTPGTIDWYVTRNIPDEYIDPVKTAVEGWNRYFRAQVGVERDVVRFMGRLPENIHLGDPRYNVINWDSRLIAGAAYESQASDPTTGKQSHSLIYMPAAWVQIGMEFWDKAAISQPDALEKVVAPNRTLNRVAMNHVNCSRDLRQAAALINSGRVAEDELKTFGKELLKATLFHEMGHALGLAHNFKGSLAFDRGTPDSAFTYSIMDYNNYELERRAFESLDSSHGPIMEYDRQIISVLYNGAKDISETDSVIPACADAEADSEQGGVDPLCTRYDIEKDPTHAIVTADTLASSETAKNDITLAQALRRMPGRLLPEESIQAIDSQDALIASLQKLITGLRGTLNYYIVSGDISIGRTVRGQMKALLMYGEDLPDGYDANEMRERVFNGVQKAVEMKALPAAAQKALTEAQDAAWTSIAKSPFMQSLPAADAQRLITILKGKVDKLVNGFTTDTQQGLPRMRASVLASLSRHAAVPYFFGKTPQAVVDYETALVGILGDAVLASDRTPTERVSAARALVSYKGRFQGDTVIESALNRLKLERTLAKDNASREVVEALIKALK